MGKYLSPLCAVSSYTLIKCLVNLCAMTLTLNLNHSITYVVKVISTDLNAKWLYRVLILYCIGNCFQVILHYYFLYVYGLCETGGY